MTGDLQAYYAARANEYDEVYAKPERQIDLRAMEGWLPPLLSGRRVLEIACGTGYWTQLLAPVAERILAIDSAPQTLKIAREKVPDARVTFLAGDAYRLPDDLGRLDSAFAGFWLSHVPRARLREFLASLNDRLEPGSRVVLLDNLYCDDSNTPISQRDRDGNTYQLRKLKDGSVHQVLKNFLTNEELHMLVSGLGDRPHFTSWRYYWGFTYWTPG
jgi:ubiquinone/menaquinone biosynthesis C-methylase UbiE